MPTVRAHTWALTLLLPIIQTAVGSTWTPVVQVSYVYGPTQNAGGPSIAISPVTGRAYVAYEVYWNPSNGNDRIIALARGIRTGRSWDWTATRDKAIEITPRGHKDGAPSLAVGSLNGQEQLHVVYWEHIGTEDLMYVRSLDGGTSWSTPLNLSQSAKIAAGASIAADAAGNVYVVWSDWVGNANANGLDVWFRRFNGSTATWEFRKKIENNPATKSQNPCIFLDTVGKLHVAWVDRVQIPRRLSYCQSVDQGATFSSPQTVFNAADTDDIGPAAVAVTPDGTVYASARTVEFAQCCEPSSLRLSVKPPGGAWSTPQEMAVTAANPYLAVDAAGHVFLSWLRLPKDGKGDIFVRARNPLGWSCAVNTTNTNSWKGYEGGHIAVDSINGFLFTATDDTPPDAPSTHRISVSWLDLQEPPLPLVSLNAQAGNQSVTLSWTSPTEGDLAAIRIVYRDDRPPTSPSDGTAVETLGVCNTTTAHVVSGLTNYVRHYFAVYLRDDYGNYSPPLFADALPNASIPGDFDVDGDVDQMDFGVFQACLSGPTVPQLKPECQAARLDEDDDVDQNDFAVFQSCLSGAGRPADPNCGL